MRVFKREIVSQSVLTRLKILVIVLFLVLFFCAIGRNAASILAVPDTGW